MKDVKQVMISQVDRSSSVVRPEAVLVTLKQLNILLMITSFDWKHDLYGGSFLCGKLSAESELTLRRLMSYIYGAPVLDVSRSHTTTQHSR